MDDIIAYDLYPNFNFWYNKLYVAKTFGYYFGTEKIPKDGIYIVRPIINLKGCGIGASIKFYSMDAEIPLDYFWSEVFFGRHITIDYTRIDDRWQQGNTFEGFNSSEDLIHFSHWDRTYYPFILPDVFDSVLVPYINIEIIDDKIIEVHLRHNTDPIIWDKFIPIWNKEQSHPKGYSRIIDPVDHIDRLGFFVKNN